MYCPYCGTESKARGALFCGKCGKSLNAAIEAPGAVVGAFVGSVQKSRTVWLAWPFWVLLLCVVSSVSGYLIFMLSGHKPITQAISGTLLWTAVLTAYVWKKQGRSGWLGFGLGLLIAMTFFTVTSFSVSYWRVREGLGPLTDMPRADAKPKIDFQPLVDPADQAGKGKWENAPPAKPNPFDQFDQFDPPASAAK